MIGLMTFTSLLLAWMGLKINHFDNDGDVIMAINNDGDVMIVECVCVEQVLER